jgi:sodium transport system permease protein
MNTILTIFKKELIDTLRDRRTLITMVVFPLLLFPVIFGLVTKLQISQAKKAQEKILRIGLQRHGNAEAFSQMLSARHGLRVIENILADSVHALIRNDSLDAAFVFAEDFDRQVEALAAGKLEMYFESTEDENITKMRLLDLTRDFERKLIAARFSKLNLDEKMIKAVRVNEIDIATFKERGGKLMGGFLPYIFVIFCFLGSMYPAIDLGAGEKERGTLETLLTSSASRLQILLGKFGVIVLTGVLSAAIGILGLYMGIRQNKEVPQALLDAILGILEPQSIALVLSLLLPLTIFFAAFLLSLSIFAKSFKEAQSIVSPLTIVVILPVAVGLIPGITLNATTALIPILNVSLATKEIIAGTISPGLLTLVYVSLIVLATISLYGCSKWFEREETIFRT